MRLNFLIWLVKYCQVNVYIYMCVCLCVCVHFSSGAVLHAMSTATIISANNGHRGTQLKLSLKLKGGQIAAFKPKWFVYCSFLFYVVFGSCVLQKQFFFFVSFMLL